MDYGSVARPIEPASLTDLEDKEVEAFMDRLTNRLLILLLPLFGLTLLGRGAAVFLYRDKSDRKAIALASDVRSAPAAISSLPLSTLFQRRADPPRAVRLPPIESSELSSHPSNRRSILRLENVLELCVVKQGSESSVPNIKPAKHTPTPTMIRIPVVAEDAGLFPTDADVHLLVRSARSTQRNTGGPVVRRSKPHPANSNR